MGSAMVETLEALKTVAVEPGSRPSNSVSIVVSEREEVAEKIMVRKLRKRKYTTIQSYNDSFDLHLTVPNLPSYLDWAESVLTPEGQRRERNPQKMTSIL